MANRKEIFVIRANGSVIGRRSGEWYGANVLATRMEPGDVIVVPQKIIGGSLFWRNLLTVAQISSSIAFTAAVAGSYRFTMRRSAMLLLVSLMFTHSYAQAHPYSPGDGYGGCDTSNMASTYVPIESWIYPAIERLALAGYVQTAFAGCVPGRGWKVRGWSPRLRSNKSITRMISTPRKGSTSK